MVARLLRLGALVENINRPTLVGIQIGVGSTVAVGQLPKLVGEGRTSSHTGSSARSTPPSGAPCGSGTDPAVSGG